MVRSYLHAFISMQYVSFLPLPAVLIFILAIIYFKTGIPALRYGVMFLALVQAGLLACFYYERSTIGNKLRQFQNVKEYEGSYIIGQAFMLEDRMLVYDRHKILEFYYRDLKALECSPGKRDCWNVTFISDRAAARDETSSLKQAQRLAAFLVGKNPALTVSGLTPEGDGILSHIESGKGEPAINL